MARGISLYMSLKDGVSGVLKTMSSSTKTFAKDTEEAQAKVDALTRRQGDFAKKMGEVRVSLIDAEKALKMATQAYKDNATAANGEELQQASEKYQNLKNNLKEYQSEINRTSREISNLRGEQSKLENRAGGGGSAGILQTLGKAGMTKMVGDVLSQGANYLVGSMFGDDIGSVFGGMLSGASNGAAMGAMMGGALGPYGVAIGAGVGTLIGGVQSIIGVQDKKDDAYKSVVQEQYTTAKSQSQSDLESGSALASQREMDQISFGKLLKGEDKAEDYLSWVKETANTTPFLYGDLTEMSKALATYQYSPEEMQDLLIKVGDTGASLGLSTPDMTEISKSIGRMHSGGKTSLEYINILNDRGIPAIKYLSDALGKTDGEIYTMISRGLIPGGEAAKIIADAMGAANQGAMELQSKTFSGLTSTVEGLNQEMQAAMGEGYNDKRKQGLEDQIEWMQSENGEQMQEANRMIGEYRASLDNLREEMLRNAQKDALDKIAREGLTGAAAGRELELARVKAENEYRKTEGYRLYQQTEIDLVNMLQDDLSTGWENYGYNMSQAFSRGLMSGHMGSALDAIPDIYDYDYNTGISRSDLGVYTNILYGDRGASGVTAMSGAVSLASDVATRPSQGGGVADAGIGRTIPMYAMGLRRVPYDGYPAILHDGERVLTASEARAQDNQQPIVYAWPQGAGPTERQSNPTTAPQITINWYGDQRSVEDQAYQVARIIASEIQQAREVRS